MKTFFQFLMLLLSSCSLFAETYYHNVQLQLADTNTVAVPGTEFLVTLEVVKKGEEITICFPLLNFQVGQCSPNNPGCVGIVPGYIITASGFLPPEWRPQALAPVSTLASSGNGFTQNVSPPSGYIVLINNSGEIFIQQAGTQQNALIAGAHTVLPFSISYIAQKKEEICFNFQISQGQIDVTQFPGTSPHSAAGDNIRDSHINDAFDGTFAWAWTDNHNASAPNSMNLFVAIGKLDKKGRLQVEKPVQITNLPANTFAWDTSIAINRQDKNNIVVSYGIIVYDSSGMGLSGQNGRAVSFDSGKTWGGVYDGVNTLPYNGLINYQTVSGFGDIPGVQADQFGNFWYGSTTDPNVSNVPYLLISSDKGITWSLAYEFPSLTGGASFDYPHLILGHDGTGQYGVWAYADYFDAASNLYPSVAFLPVTGLGSYGAGSIQFFSSLANYMQFVSIAAANDGRFWAFGQTGLYALSNNYPLLALFKSPGTLDENYAGPWYIGSQNQLNSVVSTQAFEFSSVPFFGYFYSVQGVLYDDKRNALYALFSANSPSLSQNMRLFFAISRNNGLSWSRGYDISTTAFANRGFSSMRLDQGNIYLGWYDGRNDPQMRKIQYFGGVIPAQMLDRLVEQAPLSNPIFSIPNQGSSTPPP